VDDVSYAWKNYPLNTHFFGEKKVQACRQRLIAFGSGSCSYDWEVTNVQEQEAWRCDPTHDGFQTKS